MDRLARIGGHRIAPMRRVGQVRAGSLIVCFFIVTGLLLTSESARAHPITLDRIDNDHTHGIAAVRLPVDLNFTFIGDLTQVGIVDGIVGFTLTTTAENVGSNPIPWFYPVAETRTGAGNHPPGATVVNPWSDENGFQGQEGKSNHYHVLGDADPNHRVGPHPHIQFYLFRQPASGMRTVKIGESDLKHTYRTADTNHHELAPGSSDSYGTDHNQDQSFYGPKREMRSDFTVPRHGHMGNGASLDCVSDGFVRDHGEPAFVGAENPCSNTEPPGRLLPDPGHPGHENIDHLLRAPLVQMLPQPGVRWFLAGVYFVVDDIDLANNSLAVEIFPAWDGQELTFGHGSENFRRHTIPKANVPEPTSMGLLLPALLCLKVASQRRRRTPDRCPFRRTASRQ